MLNIKIVKKFMKNGGNFKFIEIFYIYMYICLFIFILLIVIFFVNELKFVFYDIFK